LHGIKEKENVKEDKPILRHKEKAKLGKTRKILPIF
jgi:hypothetical protein